MITVVWRTIFDLGVKKVRCARPGGGGDVISRFSLLLDAGRLRCFLLCGWLRTDVLGDKNW